MNTTFDPKNNRIMKVSDLPCNKDDIHESLERQHKIEAECVKEVDEIRHRLNQIFDDQGDIKDEAVKFTPTFVRGDDHHLVKGVMYRPALNQDGPVYTIGRIGYLIDLEEDIHVSEEVEEITRSIIRVRREGYDGVNVKRDPDEIDFSFEEGGE